MQLCIMTECGPIETTGLDEEAVAEFVNAYRNGTEAVLYVPDTDPAVQDYVTRDYIVRVSTAPDVQVPVESGTP